GLLLLDRALRKRGRELGSLGQLERLAMVGTSAMGALEYEPDLSLKESNAMQELDVLAHEAAAILADQSYTGNCLDDLLNLNSSFQGARPKVLITASDDQANMQWLVKFHARNDSPETGMLEYRCSQAARLAGIAMPETRLFESLTCPGYFGVRRFDRHGKEKIHVHTACGLLHAPHTTPVLDYENLIRLTSELTRNAHDVEQMVRRMIFNVLIGNMDSHSKNFSFLMDGAYHWHLAPAYDITPCSGIGGQHWATVNGKGVDITVRDLTLAASIGGIPERRVLEFIGIASEAILSCGLKLNKL
ncbi:MAG: HipA domain-containing protein, partial [Mailhella sp.]|nr:HipA domain-containing protein [Mailhella sp.]